MKARKNQLFLAGIGIDVAHGKNSGNAGGEFFGIHHQLLAFDLKAPVGDGAELGRQAKEHQQHVQRHLARNTIGPGYFYSGERAVAAFVAGDLPDHELHFILFAQFLHLGNAGGRGTETVAAVNQDHALGLVRAFVSKVQRPVQSRVTTAYNDQIFSGKVGRILDTVEKLRAFKLLQSIDLEGAGLEGAHASGDENGLGQELRALAGFHIEAAVCLLFDHGHFLAHVVGGAEGLGLLEQGIGQFLAGAHRNGRNVVDRLVGIQLNGLAAGVGQRIDDVGFYLQQAQFENLEQAHRASPDDDGIGVNGLGKVAFGSHKQYKKKARPQPHANKNRQCASQVCKALRYAERRSIRAKRPVVVSHDPAGW